MKLYIIIIIIIIITQRVVSDSVTGTASLMPISQHSASTASSPNVKPTGGLCYLFFKAFPHMWQWNIFRMANRNYHCHKFIMVHCVRNEVYGDQKESTWCATSMFHWRSDSAQLSVYGGRMQLTKHCVQTGSAFWNCGQLGNRQRKRFQTSSDTRRRQLSSGCNAPVESTRRSLRRSKD